MSSLDRTNSNLSWRLYGSYEAVEGGRVERALMDMTGGIGEIILFSERRAQTSNFQEDIKQVIWQAYKRNSLLGCAISVMSIWSCMKIGYSVSLCISVAVVWRRGKACQRSRSKYYRIVFSKYPRYRDVLSSKAMPIQSLELLMWWLIQALLLLFSVSVSYMIFQIAFVSIWLKLMLDPWGNHEEWLVDLMIWNRIISFFSFSSGKADSRTS